MASYTFEHKIQGHRHTIDAETSEAAIDRLDAATRGDQRSYRLLPSYRTSAPKPTDAQLDTIYALDEAAAAHAKAKADSFDRCDTDGFLSQWASGINGELARTKRDILLNGGYAQFRVLCDGEGNVVATKVHHFTNQFSFAPESRWRLPDSLADGLGRRWIPTGDKSRVQKRLGLHEETRWFPAYAAIAGGGKGLSGCASCYVGVFQEGQPKD